MSDRSGAADDPTALRPLRVRRGPAPVVIDFGIATRFSSQTQRATAPGALLAGGHTIRSEEPIFGLGIIEELYVEPDARGVVGTSAQLVGVAALQAPGPLGDRHDRRPDRRRLVRSGG